MVKLLRLKGNSDKSNVEIRNHFSDSIRVKPNSKIAVRSAYANLAVVPEAENFPTQEDAGYSYQISLTGTTVPVKLPKSAYENATDLLRALQVAGNSTSPGPSDLFLGTHTIWDRVNAPSQSRFRVFKTAEGDAGFNTDWNWRDTTAFTSYDATDFTLAGTTALFGSLDFIVPLVANRLSMTINIPDDLTLAASHNISNTYLWGVKITGGNYVAIVNGADSPTGVAAAAADFLQLEKRGSTYTLSISDIGGNEKLFQDYTLNENSLELQDIFYQITAPATSTAAVSDTQLYVIDNLNPTLLGAGTPINAVLTFAQKFPPTKQLATYLGFHEAQYTNKGDPATFVSDIPMTGEETFPGIILTIDGLDLDTYNGSQDGYAQQLNILDVIYPTDKLTKLRYEPPYPMRLDLKNPNEIVIRDLTLHFAREDGRNIKYLEFTGSPVITLEIAEEGEYLD